MSKPDGFAPGAFSWVDLMTPDAAAALRFYEPLFGWSHVADHEGRGAYHLFTLSDLPVAGMAEMPPELKRAGLPATWTSYVNVEELEPVVARCQELGGRVELPPFDIRASDGSQPGRMAMLVDPAGARFSLWQAGEHRGAQLVNEPGAFAWNELLTRDPDASASFYTQLFGWTLEASHGDDMPYYEIKLGDRSNGGFLPWRPEMGDQPPAWSVYFSVRDCDESVKRLQELGGALLHGPVDIEPGRFAVVADPHGAAFQMMRVHDPE